MSGWRGLLFGIYGYRHFGKAGFEKRKQAWTSAASAASVATEPTTLEGKSIMVTGANSGIGKAAALELARRGATVHIVCRNEARGTEARNELVETTKNSSVFLHIVDLSLMHSVYEFAKKFVDSGERLDVLVNNAGVLLEKKETTSEGLDVTAATNLYSGFLLTELLLPVLERTAVASGVPSRVVSVSSGGMLSQKMNVDDPNFEEKPWDGVKAYAQTKRAQVYLTEIWSEKHPEVQNVLFYSMHPGWADTPGVEKSLPKFYDQMKAMLRSPEEGADTIVWLASSQSDDVLKRGNGKFFFDREVARTHLPLCFTESSKSDIERMWSNCRRYSKLDEFQKSDVSTSTSQSSSSTMQPR